MNERVLNYGTGADAPRTDGESGWRSLWFSLAALALIALVFAALVRGAAAQVAILASGASAVAAIVFGVRCFLCRQRNRAAVVVGLLFLVPAIVGHLVLLALAFGYIGFPG